MTQPLFPEITDSHILSWLDEKNLADKMTRTFQGFTLTDSIDNGGDPAREVTLVRINGNDQYPQHVHKDSDSSFYIVSGSAVFTSGRTRKPISPGDRIDVPRGTPHGFELDGDAAMSFVSIQSPPIRNRETGVEDFHLTDLI